MRGSAPPGFNRSIEQLFARFPLGCPLTLMVIGGGTMAAALAVHASGRVFAAPVTLLAIGVIVPPFGVVTVLRRRLRPIELRCPRCGALSRESEKPFTVQRWHDVPYAAVTCPRCGKDFTVDKYARLR